MLAPRDSGTHRGVRRAQLLRALRIVETVHEGPRDIGSLVAVTDASYRFVGAGHHEGRSAPLAEIAGELLDLLSRLVPFQAASISVYDPMTRSHETVASAGYDEPALAWLDERMPGLDASDLSEYAQPLIWLEAAVALRLYSADGRYTGILHLSAARLPTQGAAREAIADQLLRVRSLIGGLIDTMRLPSQLTADMPASARGAVVLPDATVVPLPDRKHGEHLRDGGPLPEAIAAAARRNELPERFRWRDELGGWHLIQSRLLDPGFVITEDDAELPHGLTARELDVLTLIAGGLTNPQIARMLIVSDKTVAKHVEHVLDKLGCASRAAAAALAIRIGLIQLALP
jgi:DNA-binding CsgD family transcriptional regulator